MMNQKLNELNASSKSKDEIVQEILYTLKNKDKEALKKMFSVSALKTAKNIDESIDYVMDFFDGEILSVDDDSNGGSSSNSDGIKVVEDTYRCSVTTDNGKYLVFFIYISKDTFNCENEGLYMLQVINEENIDTEYDIGQAIRCPGIYCPPVSQYTDIKFQEGTEIAGGFKFLKYQEDHSDGKFNISAIIQSDIAYGCVSISFCFYDKNGEKIGLARQSTENPVKAGDAFEVNLTARDYDLKDLKYEDIASCKFFGIDAY